MWVTDIDLDHGYPSSRRYLSAQSAYYNNFMRLIEVVNSLIWLEYVPTVFERI